MSLGKAFLLTAGATAIGYYVGGKLLEMSGMYEPGKDMQPNPLLSTAFLAGTSGAAAVLLLKVFP